MILYNVTVSVDFSIEQDWKVWMQDIHIPEVLETGYFTGHRMLKLLNDQPDATGATYAIQYELSTIGHLDTYLQKEAPSLQLKHQQRYGQKIMAFRTVLETV